MISIAFDVLGGDLPAQERLFGAVDAVKENKNIHITCVGDKELIHSVLQQNEFSFMDSNFTVIHAPEHFPMHESPSKILKSGKSTSLYKSTELVRSGACSAIISAGNTGAQMAASLFVIGRIKNISRPGIAIPFPTNKGFATLIDAGAHVDSKPQNLSDYALMGSIYQELMYGTEQPPIGILNNGSEETKGNDLSKNSYNLLKENFPSNFKGFLEGRDLFNGDFKVIVCDGFTGNIVLKTVEGSMLFMKNFLKKEINRSFKNKIGGLLIKDSFTHLKQLMDYREYGGSPLLGINGISIICHGSSDRKAIKNAILQASRLSSLGVIEKISQSV